MQIDLPPERIIRLDEGFPDPKALDQTVVFIHAVWSAPSKVSLNNLITAFQSGLDDEWKLLLLDNDKIDVAAFINAYGPFPNLGGWGEAFWIKQGKVLHADRGYYNPSVVKVLWNRVAEFTSDKTLTLPEFTADDSFKRAALKACGDFPSEHIEIYDYECKPPDDIKVGVVTMFQPDRALAIVTLRALALTLKNAAIPGMRLIVLNSDAVPLNEAVDTYGERPFAGQTYWIRYGQIVIKDKGFWMPKQKDELASRIEQFKSIRG